MDGWVKPQFGFLFLGGNFVFFVLFFSLYMLPKKIRKMDRRVGVCDLDNPSFSRILDFLKLDKTP